MVTFNKTLCAMLKNALDKEAFTPAEPPGGGGGAPMDPAAAGGGAPMDPMAAGGAPPAPMPGGGMAPPMPPTQLDPAMLQAIQTAVQQAMGGGAGGAAGGKGGKGIKGDPAIEMWKMNYLLTAIIGAMNEQGFNVKVDPQAMLGPMPGTDPSQVVAASGGAGTAGQPPGGQPGAPQDPAAAAGGAPPQQAPMPYVSSLAPKTASIPTIGSPVRPSADPPLPEGIKAAVAGVQEALSDYTERRSNQNIDPTELFAMELSQRIGGGRAAA